MFTRRALRRLFVAALGFIAFAAAGRAEIYVASFSPQRVSVFADGATASAAPLRVIEGSLTTLSFPSQVVADSLHGELLVADVAHVLVFPLQANGNVAPLRAIALPSNGLKPWGLALDLVRDRLLVSVSDNDQTGALLVYPRTANGLAAPAQTIAGAATTLKRARHMAVDPVSGEIYVTSQSGAQSGVLVFASGANGNVPPVRAIRGPHTTFVTPNGVFVDRLHDELLVADQDRGLLTFARLASGDVAPRRHLAGAKTALPYAWSAALLGDEQIVVSNAPEFENGDLLVFPRLADGNVAPARRIDVALSTIGDPSGVAVAEPLLLLHGGRFAIEGTWTTPNGDFGAAHPVPLGDGDTGTFWFFNPENVEAVVKTLDGCALNQRFWFFAGGLTNVRAALLVTDLATGAVHGYVNPQNKAFQPIQDTDAFASCTSPTAADAIAGASLSAAGDEPQAGSCSGICLNNGRYEVTGTFTTFQGANGTAHGVQLTADTAVQWFFAPTNVETVVKVIDGCAINHHRWVFAGGLTNVAVALHVRDSVTGAERVYNNPQGKAFQPVQDTNAFACN